MEPRNMDELENYFQNRIALLKQILSARNSADDYTSQTICSVQHHLEKLIQLNEEIKKETEKTECLKLAAKSVHWAFQEVDLKLDEKLGELRNKKPPSNPPKPNRPDVKSKKEIPTVKKLTSPEFASVPKYMKGRISLQFVNDIIEGMNKCIQNKYKLISTPRAQLSEAAVKKVAEYKSQEIQETKGKYFCTDGDLREHVNGAKSHNSYKSISAILRHCNRIREVRGPANLVRYVVVPDEA